MARKTFSGLYQRNGIWHIDKETYDAAVPELREALLQAQYRLKAQARFPVLILINGIEGAGKGETIKLLNECADSTLTRTPIPRTSGQ